MKAASELRRDPLGEDDATVVCFDQPEVQRTADAGAGCTVASDAAAHDFEA